MAESDFLVTLFDTTSFAIMHDRDILNWLKALDESWASVPDYSKVAQLLPSIISTMPWVRYASKQYASKRTVKRILRYLEHICCKLIERKELREAILSAIMRPFHIKSVSSSVTHAIPVYFIHRIVNELVRLGDNTFIERLTDYAPLVRWPITFHHKIFFEMVLEMAFNTHLPDSLALVFNADTNNGVSENSYDDNDAKKKGYRNSYSCDSGSDNTERKSRTTSDSCAGATDEELAAKPKRVLQLSGDSRLLTHASLLLDKLLSILLHMESTLMHREVVGLPKKRARLESSPDTLLRTLEECTQLVFSYLKNDMELCALMQPFLPCWWQYICTYHGLAARLETPVLLHRLAPKLLSVASQKLNETAVNEAAVNLLHKLVTIVTERSSSLSDNERVAAIKHIYPLYLTLKNRCSLSPEFVQQLRCRVAKIFRHHQDPDICKELLIQLCYLSKDIGCSTIDEGCQINEKVINTFLNNIKAKESDDLKTICQRFDEKEVLLCGLYSSDSF